jgi:hypothetical protein
MTFVITALKSEFLVQLSDMRLTDIRTRAVVSERQRKAIVLTTQDARLVVGWCGYARDVHGTHDTGDWLVDELHSLASHRPPELVRELASRATTRFQSISAPVNDKACTIVLAGWFSPRPNTVVPLSARISNCEDENWQRLPYVNPFFDAGFLGPSERRSKRPAAFVIISGTENAVSNELGNAIRLLLRRSTSPESVLNACIRVMRDAAGHPAYGHSIGRDFVGVEIRRDDPGALAHYFPENESREEFLPNLVSPGAAFKDAWVRY